MRPTLKFFSSGRQDAVLKRQIQRLENWWQKHKERVFDAIDYYINFSWDIDTIHVRVGRLSKKGSRATTFECRGEVFLDKPDTIHLYIGNRVRWSKKNLCVFIHELIHCATCSHLDRRFKEPGLLENWIFDELATDLITQYVMKKAVGLEPNLISSVRYALRETSNDILKDKELRYELVKRIKKIFKNYLRTDKIFFSFRRSLKDA